MGQHHRETLLRRRRHIRPPDRTKMTAMLSEPPSDGIPHIKTENRAQNHHHKTQRQTDTKPNTAAKMPRLKPSAQPSLSWARSGRITFLNHPFWILNKCVFWFARNKPIFCSSYRNIYSGLTKNQYSVLAFLAKENDKVLKHRESVPYYLYCLRLRRLVLIFVLIHYKTSDFRVSVLSWQFKIGKHASLLRKAGF